MINNSALPKKEKQNQQYFSFVITKSMDHLEEGNEANNLGLFCQTVGTFLKVFKYNFKDGVNKNTSLKIISYLQQELFVPNNFSAKVPILKVRLSLNCFQYCHS